MNHKRRRPKRVRAGCLLCKPNKLGMGMERKLGHRGFGNLRKEAAAQQDLADATCPPIQIEAASVALFRAHG